MRPDADAWDDPLGAEIYAETIATGTLYPQLAEGVLDLAAPRAGQRLLDLACGTGLITEMAAALVGPDGRIVGVDAAPAMAAVARRIVEPANAVFAACDVGRLPVADGSCDAVTCSAALWHFPGVRAALDEVARVLVAGGRFAFNVPAAQLEDLDDAPPAPLQLALTRVGLERFDRPPDAAGPVLRRSELVSWSRGAGMEVVAEQVRDVRVAQRELADLLSIPALGARMYPEVDEQERDAWVAAALQRVDPAEQVTVRWWEVLLVRS